VDGSYLPGSSLWHNEQAEGRVNSIIITLTPPLADSCDLMLVFEQHSGEYGLQETPRSRTPWQ